MDPNCLQRLSAAKMSQLVGREFKLHFCSNTLYFNTEITLYVPSLDLHMWYNSNKYKFTYSIKTKKGRIAQSVTCLATDASLTADPGVASSIQARDHTFVEIDHEIISTVILLPSAKSFKKGCCQLQAKVCAWSTG